jgi:hypothetical protein
MFAMQKLQQLAIERCIKQINFQKFNENLCKVRQAELMNDLGNLIHEHFCTSNIESNVTVTGSVISIEFNEVII